MGGKATVRYAKGCDLVSLNAGGIKEAVEAARKSEVAILFCGSASAALHVIIKVLPVVKVLI